MAEQKNGKRQSPTEEGRMGQDAEVPYDMSVSGEEDTTIWDNMVQALKPDLTPHQSQNQNQSRNLQKKQS